MSNLSVVVEGVTVSFNSRYVLRDVSLGFPPGLHVILGRNGSGKTTLFRVIDALIKPLKGSVRVLGRDVFKLSRKEVARVIGYVWQNPTYGFFEESVEREVKFILKNLGIAGREDVIEILGIQGLLDRSPFALSGGEARLVSIASVIIADQPVLLLDEPFTSLDMDGVIRVYALIKKLRSEGKTVVIATHNILLAEVLKPDTVTLLDRGVVIYHGGLSGVSDELLEEVGVVSRRWFCSVC